MANRNRANKPQRAPEPVEPKVQTGDGSVEANAPEDIPVPPLHERLLELETHLPEDLQPILEEAITALDVEPPVAKSTGERTKTRHVELLVLLNGTQYTNEEGLAAMTNLLTTSSLNWEGVEVI